MTKSEFKAKIKSINFSKLDALDKSLGQAMRDAAAKADEPNSGNFTYEVSEIFETVFEQIEKNNPEVFIRTKKTITVNPAKEHKAQGLRLIREGKALRKRLASGDTTAKKAFISHIKERKQWRSGVQPVKKGKKEIWQMTMNEFRLQKIEDLEKDKNKGTHTNKQSVEKSIKSLKGKKGSSYDTLFYMHKTRIKNALSENKPVPPEVLADYPELKVKGKMAKGGNIKKSENYLVTLSAYPNPDYDSTTHEGSVFLNPVERAVNSLKDASGEVQNFISENDLGGGNWVGDAGIVKNTKGETVARISYNGRIWPKGSKHFAEGGNIDLFEQYDKQPPELKEIVDKYQEKYIEGDMDYKDTEEFLKEVEKIGFTFDYYLDNEPYDLRAIHAKGGSIYNQDALDNIDENQIWDVWERHIGGELPDISKAKKDLIKLMNEEDVSFEEIKEIYATGGSLGSKHKEMRAFIDSKISEGKTRAEIVDLFTSEYNTGKENSEWYVDFCSRRKAGRNANIMYNEGGSVNKIEYRIIYYDDANYNVYGTHNSLKVASDELNKEKNKDYFAIEKFNTETFESDFVLDKKKQWKKDYSPLFSGRYAKGGNIYNIGDKVKTAVNDNEYKIVELIGGTFPKAKLKPVKRMIAGHATHYEENTKERFELPVSDLLPYALYLDEYEEYKTNPKRAKRAAEINKWIYSQKWSGDTGKLSEKQDKMISEFEKQFDVKVRRD